MPGTVAELFQDDYAKLQVPAVTTIARRRIPEADQAIDSDWHQTLMQMHPDAMFVLAGGQLSYANPAGLAMLHAAEPEQVLGRRLETLFSARPEAGGAPLAEQLAGKHHAGAAVAAKCQRLDGNVIEVELRGSRFRHERKSFHIVSAREMPGSQAALAAPAHAGGPARAKEALHHEKEILEMIALDKPLAHILEDVCDRMERLLGNAAVCAIALLDDDGEALTLAAAPTLPAELSRAITKVPVGPASGVCGAAIHGGLAVIIEDLAQHLCADEYQSAALRNGLRSCWGTPIRTAFGQVLGAFAVYYPARRKPTSEEQSVIADAIDLIALAIDKKRMEQSLEQSEERYRSVVSNLTEGIMVVAPGGQILTCNPSAMRILKIGDVQSAGRRHRYFKRIIGDEGGELKLGDDPASTVFRTAKAILGLSIGLELRDGSIAWLLVNALPIFDGGGTVASVLISFTDTSQVRETQRQLHYLATHDALTGLPNRHQLTQRLALAVRTADRSNQKLAILFLDLDRFKNVNDTAGHAAGDDLLKEVARRLHSCIRATDMLARLGGDEFVIVAEAFDHAGQLKDMADRILARIREPFKIDGNEYYLGTSIGISVFPHDGGDGATLLRCADSAMYHAKESGRNNYQFFTTELNVRAQHRYALETNLRRALTEQEFQVYYQPKICLQTSRIVGAEALLRWHLPDIGLIPPGEFIAIAEDLGLILPLGRWVLEQSCRQAQTWRQALLPDLVVSVNISPRQFQDPALPSSIEQILGETGLPAQALQLEITEGTLMGEAEHLLPVLNAIKRLGVSISLDDFGTGFSSLSYLQRFPIDNLKIDRSFIRDIPGKRDSVVLTRAIIAMANALGMSVTAEGVEKADQMLFLADSGCQQMQGYYFSRPVDVAAFEKLLQTRAKPSPDASP